MYDEVKRVDLNWAGKMDANEDYMYAFERLSWIDSYLQECDEILGEVGLGIDFTSRSEEIEILSEERDVLWNYIAQLQSYNEANIDNPLYKSFVNGATQTMSTIRLENYTVDNNLGLTVEYFVNGSGTGPVTIEKGKLTFEDFIGTLDGKADGNFLYTQFANGSIEDFAIIFEQQYQSMLESGMLGDDKEMTQEEFLTQFYHQGEFNHKVDKPFASFVSSVLDITIIKPFIESCTGEEWFTGNQLTDMERGLKAVFAMVDLFTLGMGSVGTEITELGAKDALVFLGKTVTIDLASNAAVYGIGELGQALDWPAPITIMLSLATGITVSCIGNKLLFKNAEGVVIRETELSDAQVNKIGEMLEGTLNPKLEKYVKDSFEGVGKDLQDNFNRYLRENVWCDDTLSNAEKIAIMKANFSKLTAEQKANFNVIADARIIANADYSNWGEWPTINWPNFPGLDSTKEVLGVSSENLKENLDRIGSLSGSNFGVMPEDGHIYTQSERSIAYIDNPEAYHQYTLDTENYFKCIDCIKDNDYKAMNRLIDELNAKNGTNIEHISEGIMEHYNASYEKFQNNSQLKELCEKRGIDSTYGVMGKAAAWEDANGEIICVGGAEQLNTPISGQILYDLGILK